MGVANLLLKASWNGVLRSPMFSLKYAWFNGPAFRKNGGGVSTSKQALEPFMTSLASDERGQRRQPNYSAYRLPYAFSLKGALTRDEHHGCYPGFAFLLAVIVTTACRSRPWSSRDRVRRLQKLPDTLRILTTDVRAAIRFFG